MRSNPSFGRAQINRADLIRAAVGGQLSGVTADFFSYQPIWEKKPESSNSPKSSTQQQGSSAVPHGSARIHTVHDGSPTQDARSPTAGSGDRMPQTSRSAASNSNTNSETQDYVWRTSHILDDAEVTTDLGANNLLPTVMPVLHATLAIAPDPQPANYTSNFAEQSGRAKMPVGEHDLFTVDRLFWRSSAYAAVEQNQGIDSSQSAEATPNQSWAASAIQPSSLALPLGPFSALVPSLRKLATHSRAVQSPNLKLLQRYAEKGEGFYRIPKMKRRRWGHQLWLLFDASDRLIPYRADYAELCKALERLFPWGRIRRIWWDDGANRLVPPSGTTVLALTDLGGLATSSFEPHKQWRLYGLELQRARCPAVAILPGAPLRRRDDAVRHWRVISWQRLNRPVDAQNRSDALRQLLVLAAPAHRVEPSLLRQLRRLLGGSADPGLEAAFWQAPELASSHPTAATINPQARKRLRAAFAKQKRTLRHDALMTIQRSRLAKGLEPLFAAEVKQLDADSQDLIPKETQEAHRIYFEALAAKAAAGDASPSELAWSWEFTQDLDLQTVRDPDDRRILTSLWRATRDLPIEVPNFSSSRYVVLQNENTLEIERVGSATASGSPLGFISSTDSKFALEVDADFLWKSEAIPSFVSSWGCDAIGYWLEFQVQQAEPVAQRMRWIPAGHFIMGSDQVEPGQLGRDTPEHEVTITDGFWIFDTACTQALWTAVMGANPSLFQSPRRPVENVSWHDAQKFIRRINNRLPGLDLSLPNEAQWEYACRAGTRTTYSFGQAIPPGRAHFGGLLSLTASCASLPANSWGLYEMHGNVWEWCEDGPRSYSVHPIADPLGPTDEHSHRVIRGGDWASEARAIRSANRESNHPSYRDWGIGFRCVRGLTGAEPEDNTKRELEQPREFRRPFVIRSDVERISITPLRRPIWASSIGRDNFGLWSEFRFGDGAGVATQRMRWIIPGRFAMGSAQDENGSESGEQPQHEVAISKGFWLFDTPCRQDLWSTVMGFNPSSFRGDHQPVENVSWIDAKEFIHRINQSLTGLELSLPTEAQWEYACRAGTITPYSFGNTISTSQVNFSTDRTVSCASLPANPWGLYEMHGNVWEWCEDSHRTYSGHSVIDPTGPATTDLRRTLRGGSWDRPVENARSANRHVQNMHYKANNIGFRCVRLK